MVSALMSETRVLTVEELKTREQKTKEEIVTEQQYSTMPLDQQKVCRLASVMPLLAEEPLQPPQFFQTGWKVGQKFNEKDDPDRILEAWELPDSFRHEDQRAQQLQTTVEELQVPNPDGSFARVVRKVLSEEHCAGILNAVNAKKFSPALINIGAGMQQFVPEVRNGHRALIDSPELAAWLLAVLRPYLPEQLADGSYLVGLNERFRFLCYTPGQFFKEHYDGHYIRPHGHPQAGDQSKITVQLYLHDVPERCGGATTFFPGEQYSVKNQPEAGSVLLFTQDLLHEGSLLEDGIKYSVRTEVMYSRPKLVRSYSR
jgi:predicted 2-oxoglutarate/Fe(II)-dependent dioxygenase YbiX